MLTLVEHLVKLFIIRFHIGTPSPDLDFSLCCILQNIRSIYSRWNSCQRLTCYFVEVIDFEILKKSPVYCYLLNKERDDAK